MTSDLRARLDLVSPEEIDEAIMYLFLKRKCVKTMGIISAPAGPMQKAPEKLLTIEEVLLLFPGVTRRLLLRRTRGLRFRREFSRKKILFEEAGLQKWIISLGVDKKTS